MDAPFGKLLFPKDIKWTENEFRIILQQLHALVGAEHTAMTMI